MAIQRTLTFGTRGSDVRELQLFLQTVRIDGRPLHDGEQLGQYDETTQYAVTRLQAALIKGGTLEIKEPTGNYGPLTQQAWDKANANIRAYVGIESVTPGPSGAEDVITVTAEKEAATGMVQQPVSQLSNYRPSFVGRALNRIGEINIPALHQGPHSYAITQQQRYIAEHGVSTEPMRSPHVEDAIITSGHGMRRHPITGERKMHAGLDSVALHDRQLVAPVGGFIVRNGGGRGFGENVVIYSDRNEKVILAHLQHGSIPKELSDGARVETGQPIGIMGSTGRSTGAHLHTEVHKAKNVAVVDGREDFESRAQDPMTLFALRSRKQGYPILAAYQGGTAPQREETPTQSAAVLMQSIIKAQGFQPLPATIVALNEPSLATNLPGSFSDTLEPVSISLKEAKPTEKNKTSGR